jgi:hypothetical protein
MAAVCSVPGSMADQDRDAIRKADCCPLLLSVTGHMYMGFSAQDASNRGSCFQYTDRPSYKCSHPFLQCSSIISAIYSSRENRIIAPAAGFKIQIQPVTLHKKVFDDQAAFVIRPRMRLHDDSMSISEEFGVLNFWGSAHVLILVNKDKSDDSTKLQEKQLSTEYMNITFCTFKYWYFFSILLLPLQTRVY